MAAHIFMACNDHGGQSTATYDLNRYSLKMCRRIIQLLHNSTTKRFESKTIKRQVQGGVSATAECVSEIRNSPMQINMCWATPTLYAILLTVVFFC